MIWTCNDRKVEIDCISKKKEGNLYVFCVDLSLIRRKFFIEFHYEMVVIKKVAIKFITLPTHSRRRNVAKILLNSLYLHFYDRAPKRPTSMPQSLILHRMMHSDFVLWLKPECLGRTMHKLRRACKEREDKNILH